MLTDDAFRRLALESDGVSEGAHQGHADFRAFGRVFATLGYPQGGFAMVKLTPDQQRMVVDAEPAIFSPVAGGWGRKGATLISLAEADDATARSALRMAWGNVNKRRPGGKST
jgi:hypothetical protein